MFDNIYWFCAIEGITYCMVWLYENRHSPPHTYTHTYNTTHAQIHKAIGIIVHKSTSSILLSDSVHSHSLSFPRLLVNTIGTNYTSHIHVLYRVSLLTFDVHMAMNVVVRGCVYMFEMIFISLST